MLSLNKIIKSTQQMLSFPLLYFHHLPLLGGEYHLENVVL